MQSSKIGEKYDLDSHQVVDGLSNLTARIGDEQAVKYTKYARTTYANPNRNVACFHQGACRTCDKERYAEAKHNEIHPGCELKTPLRLVHSLLEQILYPVFRALQDFPILLGSSGQSTKLFIGGCASKFT
jgi:hypothetical protein